MLDWELAEKHLEQCEKAYTEICNCSYFALTMVIRPLRNRFNSGERTEALYNEIMRIAL